MKRILFIITPLALASFSWGAAAPGTITQTFSSWETGSNYRELVFSWVGSADDGSVPATGNAIVSADNLAALLGFYLYQVETNPGSTAPTAAYDIAINNTAGRNVAGGALANRSATATEQTHIITDTANNVFGGEYIRDAWTVVITGNSVNSATGTVTLKFTK